MKLHEYQAKAILRQAGLPVPKGEVVFKAEEVSGALAKLGLTAGVAKAQAYTGGRGKAGGIKLYKSAEEALAHTQQLIGMTLVTKQTGPEGVKIHAVLLEEASVIKRELYVAVTLDRAKANIVFILSPEGGMDIEEVAEKTPDRILKLYPAWGRTWTRPSPPKAPSSWDWKAIRPSPSRTFWRSCTVCTRRRIAPFWKSIPWS